jgi:transcriptional regulator with XRE-family HTH domain
MEEQAQQPAITFAELVRQAMQEQQLTLSSLARTLGVPAFKLEAYIKGHQNPSIAFCQRLSLALKVPIDKICFSIDPTFEERDLSELLTAYRALPHEERRVINRLVGAMRDPFH